VDTNAANPLLYMGSVLVCMVPEAGSVFETAIMNFVRLGGKAMFLGAVDRASKAFCEFANLTCGQPIDGRLSIELAGHLDIIRKGAYPNAICHRPLMCGGGINTLTADETDTATTVLATVETDGQKRVVSLHRQMPNWNGGGLLWLRGTNSCNYIASETYEEEALLPRPDRGDEYFASEILLRYALERFGVSVRVMRETVNTKPPVLMAHCSNNGYFFSGYVPDTTTELALKFPLGAPLMLGWETKLCDGHSVYRMPRAFHAECRVFVEQASDDVLSFREVPSISYQVRRRLQVTGLHNATVRIFPETDCVGGDAVVLLNPPVPYFVGRAFDRAWKQDENGGYLEAKNVTGTLIISFPAIHEG